MVECQIARGRRAAFLVGIVFWFRDTSFLLAERRLVHLRTLYARE